MPTLSRWKMIVLDVLILLVVNVYTVMGLFSSHSESDRVLLLMIQILHDPIYIPGYHNS